MCNISAVMMKNLPFLKNIELNWPIFAGLISATMLAIAHAFEAFGGLSPCALCLHQREVYWVALGISALAMFVRFLLHNHSLMRAVNAILAVVFLSGAAIAFFHSGVEQHWWKGLPECAKIGNVVVAEDLLGALSKSMNTASCDEIPWAFLGLSMAVWNTITSLGLALISVYCALKGDTGALVFSEDAK